MHPRSRPAELELAAATRALERKPDGGQKRLLTVADVSCELSIGRTLAYRLGRPALFQWSELAAQSG